MNRNGTLNIKSLTSQEFKRSFYETVINLPVLIGFVLMTTVICLDSNGHRLVME